MNKEKSEELRAIFPELFSDYPHLPFECGDGWFDLLKWCLKRMKIACDREKIDPKATQIKEKYGTLRFYTDWSYDVIEGIIEAAEEMSSKTCERCGKPGSLRGAHWVTTLCDECESTKK